MRNSRQARHDNAQGYPAGAPYQRRTRLNIVHFHILRECYPAFQGAKAILSVHISSLYFIPPIFRLIHPEPYAKILFML